MEALERLDTALFRAERAVVAAMLAVMGVVVFLDVVHRVSTRTGSWMANPLALGAVAALLGILAFRTREDARAVVKGVGFGAAVAALQWLFVRLVPNGVVWSQTVALALTLWLGLLGASLAAHDRRHLALDIGSKVWPKAVAHRVAAVGHLLTAAFCVLLLVLASRSILAHWELWSSTEGAAGTLPAVPIPKWAAYASIPVGMTLLALRFSLEAWRVWTGREAIGGDDTLRQLGIQEEAS